MSEKFTSASLESLILEIELLEEQMVFFNLPEGNAGCQNNEAHLVITNFPTPNQHTQIFARNLQGSGYSSLTLTFDQADELATYLQYFAKLGRESGSS